MDVILRMGSSAEDAQWGQTTKNNLASIFVVFKKGSDIDQYIKELKKEHKTFEPAELDYIKRVIQALVAAIICNST